MSPNFDVSWLLPLPRQEALTKKSMLWTYNGQVSGQRTRGHVAALRKESTKFHNLRLWINLQKSKRKILSQFGPGEENEEVSLPSKMPRPTVLP